MDKYKEARAAEVERKKNEVNNDWESVYKKPKKQERKSFFSHFKR